MSAGLRATIMGTATIPPHPPFAVHCTRLLNNASNLLVSSHLDGSWLLALAWSYARCDAAADPLATPLPTPRLGQ